MYRRKNSENISKFVLSLLCVALFICCLFFASEIYKEEISVKDSTQTDTASQTISISETTNFTETNTTLGIVETTLNELTNEASGSLVYAESIVESTENREENTKLESTAQTQFQTESVTEEIISNAKVVYITQSGKKYHLQSCSYLSKSKTEISRDDAISKGYEPCSRCKP